MCIGFICLKEAKDSQTSKFYSRTQKYLILYFIVFISKFVFLRWVLFLLLLPIFYVCACLYLCLIVSNSLPPHELYSPPGSSVCGILWARILEWVAISSFRGSSRPRDQTYVSCISCIGRQILHCCTTWEAPFYVYFTTIHVHLKHLSLFVRFLVQTRTSWRFPVNYWQLAAMYSWERTLIPVFAASGTPLEELSCPRQSISSFFPVIIGL